jgi:hypothetical protein
MSDYSFISNLYVEKVVEGRTEIPCASDVVLGEIVKHICSTGK